MKLEKSNIELDRKLLNLFEPLRYDLQSATWSILQDLTYENRYTLHPRLLKSVANEEVDFFLEIVQTPNSELIRNHGAERAFQGLSEIAILQIIALFRKTLLQKSGSEVELLRYGLSLIDEYSEHYLTQFLRTTQQEILEDQEELRQALADALHEQRRELSIKNHAIQTSINGIMLTDLEGVITFVNPAFLNIWRFESADEVLNHHISDFCGDNSFEDIRMKVLEKGGWQSEFSATIDGDQKSEIFIAASLIRDDHSNPVGFMASFSDITEQKQMEEQLQKAQKLEAVGNLAGGVAHDFNNLLTVIIGFTDMLLMKTEKDSNLVKYGKGIKESAEKAASLTQQLLAFSRKQVLQPRVIDFAELLPKTEHMLRQVIDDNINLQFQIADGLGLIKADPVQIEQVLLNLVINARDAMPKGGSIHVRLRNIFIEDSAVPKQYADMSPGPYIEVTVSDTGIGMDEKIQDRIFEPFFTTKSSGKGTGLGLATVYGIVRQSEGNIFVQSDRMVGTTFTVLLPRIDEVQNEFVQQTESHTSDIPTEKRTGKILIVEDEEAVRTMASDSLKMYGFQTLQAVNGQQALEVLKKKGNGNIDLVLTDIRMPLMGGYELAKKIKSINPDMKVLLMSGFTDANNIKREISEHHVEFIQKPFSPVVLVKRIIEMLD